MPGVLHALTAKEYSSVPLFAMVVRGQDAEYETKSPEVLNFRNPKTVLFRFSLCICRCVGGTSVEDETNIRSI
jgi:hypothetical protein